MEKYQKVFDPEELRKILNEHMGVQDTRIHCLMGRGGLSWEGVLVSVYDDVEPNKEKEFTD